MAALLIVAAGMLAGCGGATKTVIVQGPPSQSTASTATTPATGTSRAPATSTTGAARSGEAPSRFLALAAFQSPTGNIGCMIVSELARCDIVSHSWQLPPRPSSCPQIVDFGQGLEVGSAGTARFVCAGDTVREPASPKLAYGSASRVGPFECVSRSSGMTCTDAATGHGFQLSIQRYQLF